MKKWLKVLPLTLLLALPIKAKTEDIALVLPLVWSRNFVQAINYIQLEGEKESKYSFLYRSVAPVPEFADRFLDNFYETDWNITWGGSIRWDTNYTQWADLTGKMENDYKSALKSYEELQKKINVFVDNVDSLENRVNNPEFTQNVNDIKGFISDWENTRPIDVNYFKESDYRALKKIVDEMSRASSGFNGLSEFITEAENNISQYDTDTKNLIYAASDSRKNVSEGLHNLTLISDGIYSRFINSGLDNPSSKINYEIGFALFFHFGPGPK